MMYLVVILVASVLINLFLFIERQSLTKANTSANKSMSTQKKQMQNYRNSFASVCSQTQQQLQHDYLEIEFSSDRQQEVLKFLLDKLPAVLICQAETGLGLKKALAEIGATSEMGIDELDQFFRTQDRDVKRLWQGRESDALLELCQLMLRKAQVEANSKAAMAS